jgi:hypothetical protein
LRLSASSLEIATRILSSTPYEEALCGPCEMDVGELRAGRWQRVRPGSLVWRPATMEVR